MQSASWYKKGIPAKGKGNVISSTLLGIYVISLCFPSFTSSTYLILVKECIHYIRPKTRKNKEKLISIKGTWCSPLQILSPVIIQHSTNHPHLKIEIHPPSSTSSSVLLLPMLKLRVQFVPSCVNSLLIHLQGTSQDDYFRLRM